MIKPSLMTSEPRSEGLSNNPKNLSGALSKPESRLKIGNGCRKGFYDVRGILQ